MTTTRPVPGRSIPGQRNQARRASRSRAGASVLFFEPAADRVAGDAEGPGQAAQTTALLIGAQDLFALFFGVAIGLWLLAAAPLAVLAQVALLPIFCQAVLDDLFATAVVALDMLSDHYGVRLSSLTRLCHYHFLGLLKQFPENFSVAAVALILMGVAGYLIKRKISANKSIE